MATKRQHLVWRKYLSSWTTTPNITNGKTVCYFKQQDNIVQYINIENVAVQSYAYDISMINDEDKKVVSLYFDKWIRRQTTLNIRSKITNSDDIFEKDYIENNFICPIEENGIEILDKLSKEKFPFDGPTILEDCAELLRCCLLNSLLSNDQLFSEEDIKQLCYSAISQYNGEDARYVFYEFIAVQMLRTWRSRDSILNSIKETIERFESSCLQNTTEAMFPLMMVVNAQILATAFCKNNFYIELLKNETNQDFITGDFPIINLYAEYDKINESLDKMELYYPINPRVAIICKNSIYKNTTTSVKDEAKVDEYNRKIIASAIKQVYAIKESDIKKYILPS